MIITFRYICMAASIASSFVIYKNEDNEDVMDLGNQESLK